MKIEIKHRYTGTVLFALETISRKLCVEAAAARKIDLSYSDLSGSDLSYSDLSGSNLSYSDLSGSDLRGSDLSDSNLRGSDLSGSDLSGSDLSDSNLSGAKNANYAIACTRILPEGELIGWKKVAGRIVKLRIPADAKRSHAFGRKCRCEFADVLAIEGAIEILREQNAHGSNTGPAQLYKIGERVIADKWDEDFTHECSHGIHFFITRLEAENF